MQLVERAGAVAASCPWDAEKNGPPGPAGLKCCGRHCLLSQYWVKDSSVWDIFDECRAAKAEIPKQTESAAGEVKVQPDEVKGGFDAHGGYGLVGGSQTGGKAKVTAATMDPLRSLRRTRKADFDEIVTNHYKDLNVSTTIHPDGKPLCLNAIRKLTVTTIAYWTPARIEEAGARRGQRMGSRDLCPDLDSVRMEGCNTIGCTCLENTEQDTIDHFGQRYEDTEGARDGDVRRWEVLKAAAIAQPLICASSFQCWLGVGKNTLRNVRTDLNHSSARKIHGGKGRGGSTVAEPVGHAMAAALTDRYLGTTIPTTLYLTACAAGHRRSKKRFEITSTRTTGWTPGLAARAYVTGGLATMTTPGRPGSGSRSRPTTRQRTTTTGWRTRGSTLWTGGRSLVDCGA